jgi:hypothetical protein
VREKDILRGIGIGEKIILKWNLDK